MVGLHYIKLILPLKLDWEPWYSCTEELGRGDRVSVVFARREYVAVVKSVSGNPDIDISRIQPILRHESSLPPVSMEELKFWEFISSYYMCTEGEVYKAAYPGAKINSEKIAASTRERAERSREKILESLKGRVARLEERLHRKQEIIDKSRPGTKANETARQERLKISDELNSARMALAKFEAGQVEAVEQGNLNIPAEESMLESHDKPVVLKGDGRTEVYISETQRQLASGKNVLILVPETAFGNNMEEELRLAFGSRMRTFNSGMTAASRRKSAEALRESDNPEVILGTRSSLFLPFRNLGLIIVDEEQDSSYKQTEPSPRYNARDCSVMLARIHGARIILGSVSPSLETEENILSGKYLESVSNVPQNAAEIIDLSAERRKRGVDGLFSFKLIEAVRASSLPLTIIRGWEKEEEIEEQLGRLFPGRKVEILTPQAARKQLAAGGLCAILQADALFNRNDFRSDERTLQILKQFQSRSSILVIQTKVSGHPVFKALEEKAGLGEMLKERSAFNLPPYCRLVDIHTQSDADADQLQKRLAAIVPNATRIAPDTIRCAIPRNAKLAGVKADIAAATDTRRAWFDVDPA